MRRAIFLFIILVIAIILGVLIAQDPGYLLMTYQDWTLEMPLWLAAVATVLAIGLIYFIFSLIHWIVRIPYRLHHYLKKRALCKANKQTSNALVALAQGNWYRAEQQFTKGLTASTIPLVNYLGAAKAAQQQKNYIRRDTYLQQAQAIMPNDFAVLEIAKSQLQLENHQYEQALVILQPLAKALRAHKHPYIFKLLTVTLLQLEKWYQLRRLLKQLSRYQIFPQSKLRELEFKTYQGILTEAINHKKLSAIEQTWQDSPHTIRQSPLTLALYVKKLIAENAMTKAEATLSKALHKQWDDELIKLYGSLTGLGTKKQLAKAEKWFKAKPNNAPLLFALGKLCLQSKLWGKARHYLEQCVAVKPNSIYFAELAKLLEQMGEKELAYAAYRDGLNAAIKVHPLA